jgi:Domain of unknown function (DUF4411)
MTPAPAFVLDSNVFITAKNAYYAFEICPGFWKGILRAHSRGQVGSIDHIRIELLRGRKEEDLVQWVTKEVPADFFCDSTAGDVTSAYQKIMLWVQRNPQYFDQAKAQFATEADGWLAAYSMVNGTVVVTDEQPHPESKSHVFLPDVCRQFQVPYKGTFVMLRELSVRLDLAAG